MDPSEEKEPSDVMWLIVLVLLGAVGGAIVADMLLRVNDDRLGLVIPVGLGVGALGIGYGASIKNPLRLLLLLAGGFGMGLVLRGFATMM